MFTVLSYKRSQIQENLLRRYVVINGSIARRSICEPPLRTPIFVAETKNSKQGT